MRFFIEELSWPLYIGLQSAEVFVRRPNRLRVVSYTAKSTSDLIHRSDADLASERALADVTESPHTTQHAARGHGCSP